ncbi:MAG: hypothetical protein K8F92_09850 [Hyphomicrobium sp.]|uniref:hypothetical protein n=1 Tax=Hyphomicrobium sp. TaxID=82 RepID=UPI001311793A|nr:hypothetical protein [Hyphomicrobium sp.]KAB2910632.1 MAG: hypothetical protein F9K29_24545 [Hyphomicrobiaceae bacterium]MBZ0209941.1 hypothetical protein [Hyphomicrobium sp.]MCZ7594633.1 hypothetical protein [Hyphomicrobium sp.]
MKRSIIAAIAVALASSLAVADEKPTQDEASKIKEVVAAWGCEGGTFEKESEGTGVFEAEDVKCRGANYDFRLTKDFKVFAITMD